MKFTAKVTAIVYVIVMLFGSMITPTVQAYTLEPDNLVINSSFEDNSFVSDRTTGWNANTNPMIVKAADEGITAIDGENVLKIPGDGLYITMQEMAVEEGALYKLDFYTTNTSSSNATVLFPGCLNIWDHSCPHDGGIHNFKNYVNDYGANVTKQQINEDWIHVSMIFKTITDSILIKLRHENTELFYDNFSVRKLVVPPDTSMIKDGSFESTYFNSDRLNHWNSEEGVISVKASDVSMTAIDGEYIAMLPKNDKIPRLSQEIPVVPGEEYTLTYYTTMTKTDVVRPGCVVSYGHSCPHDGEHNHKHYVQNYGATHTSEDLGNGWLKETIEFTALPDLESVLILFRFDNNEVFVDNVTLEGPVPGETAVPVTSIGVSSEEAGTYDSEADIHLGENTYIKVTTASNVDKLDLYFVELGYGETYLRDDPRVQINGFEWTITRPIVYAIGDNTIKARTYINDLRGDYSDPVVAKVTKYQPITEVAVGTDAENLSAVSASVQREDDLYFKVVTEVPVDKLTMYFEELEYGEDYVEEDPEVAKASPTEWIIRRPIVYFQGSLTISYRAYYNGQKSDLSQTVSVTTTN